MKKYLLTILFPSILFSSGAYAYEESQEIVLKFRGLYNTISGKQSNLPAAWTPFSTGSGGATPIHQSVGKLYAMGVGGEASVDIFINDYIAAEASSGVTAYRGKKSTISVIQDRYNDNPVYDKKRNLYAIPSALLLQYHIAPFGSIRPYLGGGYHYTFMKTNSQAYTLDNASGPVMQAGVDFVFQDDTYLNFDVKKYVLTTKVKYKSPIRSGADGKSPLIKSTMKFDPLSIGLGIGFKL